MGRRLGSSKEDADAGPTLEPGCSPGVSGDSGRRLSNSSHDPHHGRPDAHPRAAPLSTAGAPRPTPLSGIGREAGDAEAAATRNNEPSGHRGPRRRVRAAAERCMWQIAVGTASPPTTATRDPGSAFLLWVRTRGGGHQ